MKEFSTYGFLLWFLIFSQTGIIGYSQNESAFMVTESKRNKAENFSVLSEENLAISNPDVLTSFFDKLKFLSDKKEQHVRVVHIGDSHIQGGFFTGKTRDILQSEFGNGGLGFIFPYRLAKSNGNKEILFSSSAPWKGKRNIFADESDLVGISGYELTTEATDFAVKLEVKESEFYFNTIKLFTPYTTNMFSFAETNESINFQNYVTEKKSHYIRSGEVLSVIARKYGVSVSQIKAANGLKSDVIRAGGTLTIPVKTQKPKPIDRSVFKFLQSQKDLNYYSYYSASPKHDIWLLPNPIEGNFILNGVVLENDLPGVIYSAIGVNGARFRDYNKTELFFHQLSGLEPDLIVISLGTNEAFDKLEPEEYLEELFKFIAKTKTVVPDIPILLTTPPPALERRSVPNKFSKKYTEAINDIDKEKQLAVWDLFSVLGGLENIKVNAQKKLLAGDYIHYSKKGYEYSGTLFAEALMNAFYNYIENN